MTGRTGCQRPRQKLQASMRLHKELDPPRRKRRSPKTMLVRKERGPGGLSVPRCSPSSCSELGWSRARRPVLEGAGGLREQSLRTGTRAHLTRLLVYSSPSTGGCVSTKGEIRTFGFKTPPPPASSMQEDRLLGLFRRRNLSRRVESTFHKTELRSIYYPLPLHGLPHLFPPLPSSNSAAELRAVSGPSLVSSCSPG